MPEPLQFARTSSGPTSAARPTLRSRASGGLSSWSRAKRRWLPQPAPRRGPSRWPSFLDAYPLSHILPKNCVGVQATAQHGSGARSTAMFSTMRAAERFDSISQVCCCCLPLNPAHSVLRLPPRRLYLGPRLAQSVTGECVEIDYLLYCA